MMSHSEIPSPLRGIVPPMIMPLLDRDRLDRAGLERLIEHILAGGVSGLFILGTTGEAPGLSQRLQRELIKSVCMQVGTRVPVLVGITDPCFTESVELACVAARAGASAVVTAAPFCARTTDGGKTWRFVSWIGPEPPNGFSIMPSSVRLSKSEIRTSFRHEENFRKGPNWIEVYLSKDNGKTWEFQTRAFPDTGTKSGNPPSLVRLKDGRLVITYGYRSAPYAIRARISSDNGRTWSDDIDLRTNGGAWDIGYTRSVQRPDGKIVTVYYWAADPKKERTIEATIWDPGKGGK